MGCRKDSHWEGNLENQRGFHLGNCWESWKGCHWGTH